MVCRHCGNEIAEGARFCLVCGAPAEDSIGGGQPEKRAGRPFRRRGTRTEKPAPALDGRTRRLLRIGGAAALAVLVLVLILVPLMRGLGKNRPLAAYLKADGVLYQIDLSRPAAPRSFEKASLRPETERLLQYSSDAVWMAYPGTASEGGSFPLYLQKTRGGNPVLIAEAATDYRLLDGGRILYTDAEDTLFLSDSKGNSTELDGAVAEFFTDRAEENAVWTVRGAEGGLQLYTRPLDLDGERKRLAQGFDSFVSSPDGQSFALLSGDTLWLSSRFREAGRLDSRVTAVSRVLDSGKVYYEREIMDSTLYCDLLSDDLLLADAAARMGTDRSSEAYRAAVERDTLRERLRAAAVADGFRELCACSPDGTLEYLGIGRMEDYSADTVAWESAELREGQIRMSEFYELWSRTGEFERSLLHNSLRRAAFDMGASTGFFLRPEEGTGTDWDLYSYPLSRGMERETLISGHTSNIAGVDGDDVWYFADAENGSYTLCRNDKALLRGAVPEGFHLSEGSACCFTGWDAAAGAGTLNLWDGKTFFAAGEDVTPEGLTLLEGGACFLDGGGALWVYDGKDCAMAGENVRAYLSRGAAHTAYLAASGELRAAGGGTLDSGVAYLLGGVTAP